jgi:hypothetical protein
VALISFDIDGTMEFGHPPGPVTVEFVRALAVDGHLIGSASDRTRSDQSGLWEAHGIEVAFVGGKHHLHEVRARFPDFERHVHIGDTHVDEHYARLAGFEFCPLDEWERLAHS